MTVTLDQIAKILLSCDSAEELQMKCAVMNINAESLV